MRTVKISVLTEMYSHRLTYENGIENVYSVLKMCCKKKYIYFKHNNHTLKIKSNHLTKYVHGPKKQDGHSIQIQ